MGTFGKSFNSEILNDSLNSGGMPTIEPITPHAAEQTADVEPEILDCADISDSGGNVNNADNADNNDIIDKTEASDSAPAAEQELNRETAEITAKPDNDGVISEIKSISDGLNAKFDDVARQISSLQTAVIQLSANESALSKSVSQSVALNKLHEDNLAKEVDEHKKGVYFTNIKPFLMFLIDMVCNLKKSKQVYLDDKEAFIAENNESVFNEIVNLIDFYIKSFENQLKIQGVEITSFEEDSDFVSDMQSARTVKTDDAAKNGKIAEVLSDCYSYGQTVLRKANVTVYKA